MIFRLLPFVIVVFWLVMSGLLVKVNVRPDDSAMLRVPVQHVLKVVFLHGLNSDLNILADHKRIGNLSLRPRELVAGQPRRFDFTGNLVVDFPTRQTFRWDGSVQVNAALELEDVVLNVDLRKTNTQVALHVGADRVLHYDVRGPGFAPTMGSWPLDKALPEDVLEPLGINLDSLKTLPGGMKIPTVTAQQNRIHLRSEEVEVYQISVRQGEMEVASLAVSQLGQILMARSIFGYSLQAEDISP